MKLEPYVFFEGRCAEALAFYQEALSAEVLFMMTNGQSPDQSQVKPGTEHLILHATLRVGATTLMVSDGLCTGTPIFAGFALSVAAENADEARGWFEALAAGGEVRFPLQETFWSPCFGMVTDRFGVLWMVTKATP
jgi:PhnB protein